MQRLADAQKQADAARKDSAFLKDQLTRASDDLSASRRREEGRIQALEEAVNLAKTNEFNARTLEQKLDTATDEITRLKKENEKASSTIQEMTKMQKETLDKLNKMIGGRPKGDASKP